MDLFEMIYQFDEQENAENHDQKIEHRRKELPVSDHGNRFRLGVGERNRNAFRRLEHVEQARKVGAAEDQADGRHDHSLYQRCDDATERGADDDADRKINDVATGDKVAELFPHGRILFAICDLRFAVRD